MLQDLVEFFFPPRESKEKREERERRSAELWEWKQAKKEARRERREAEEYRRAEERYERRQRADRIDRIADRFRAKDYDVYVPPEKDHPERAPQRPGPSLSEQDRQRGTSPDDRKFYLQLIFVILSLWLCGMGSFVIVAIIGFLWR
jgi:hypothetical protein